MYSHQIDPKYQTKAVIFSKRYEVLVVYRCKKAEIMFLIFLQDRPRFLSWLTQFEIIYTVWVKVVHSKMEYNSQYVDLFDFAFYFVSV